MEAHLGQDRLVPPPQANSVCCSDECYRQCSPDSCPGLTAQCTDRCVVVACLDPHDDDDDDDDHEGVCGDIICDDQSCTDPTDCHGIYEFLQCCDNYHDYFRDPKSPNLDHNATAASFNDPGWDPTLNLLLGQGYQHGPHEHSPVGYYGMAASPPTLTPGTITATAVPSSRSSTPSTSSPSHSYAHLDVFQQNHHQQQRIADHPPPFHGLTHPGKGLTFESHSPRPPDLPPAQLQSHLDDTGKHSCMWADCDAVFRSLQDLVAHVNFQHLQIVSPQSVTNNQLGPSRDPASSHHQLAPALDSTSQFFPSCHWGDCHVYPTVEDVPGSSDRPLDAALGVLAAHLWEYHLGLHSPPPQFNFPSATTLVAESVGDLIHSPSLDRATPKIQGSVVEVEIMDVDPPFVSVSSVAVGATTPSELGPASSHEYDTDHTQDKNRSHDQGHDCTIADHPCRWLDCQERFATCEALMAHITAEHVGGGKNHYGCFWDGCGRNGNKGFKSKQKICRHLQSHTGHRPHQCEVCQQCFSEVATLQQHMRRHTQEKPYECDHPGCGKRFAIMGALTIHKRMHNGDKPFKCPQCDKAFSESSNLSKHLRTHTGARPYVCSEPGCGKCFGRGDQLTRHMNVHSGGGKVVKKAVAAATTKVV